MELVRGAISLRPSTAPHIALAVDRLTLAKRRWRGIADDGREFGFDLDHPLEDGAIIFQSESVCYHLAQKPEPVLEISLGATPEAAFLGWSLGNLHFPVEIEYEILRVIDDPAVRQMLERERIAYIVAQRVFHPIKSAHYHG